jgi:hypothetical protein
MDKRKVVNLYAPLIPPPTPTTLAPSLFKSYSGHKNRFCVRIFYILHIKELVIFASPGEMRLQKVKFVFTLVLT